MNIPSRPPELAPIRADSGPAEGPAPQTRMLHHRTDAADALPSVTPLYQSSAFERGSPYFYTRKDNPNIAELEECLCILEGAAHAVAFSTGMAAMKACLEWVSPGETIVAHTLAYGCSVKLLQRFCEKRGLTLVVDDLTRDGFSFDALSNVGLVLFETPTNPFLRTLDIARVSDSVKRRHPGAIVVVDNTWATPLFQHPLEHGADVSLLSATKYISGHSDVMGGAILTDREDLAEHMRGERFYAGAVPDPFAAWLLRRSLATLPVRLAAQARTTRRMRDVLHRCDAVETVYYPDVDGRQLVDYGGILFVQLAREAGLDLETIAGRLSWFGTGTGMACVTSMVAQPHSGSHASMTDAEKAAIGLDHGLIRLCFGLEDPGDLERDLLQALRP